jgi:2-oxoacid:acceptor oxidoreductase delta subunit (pyruvate/2-ketoisovalerate family)
MLIGPIIAKPGTSKRNKTGSWRTGKKPIFLQKNCIACKLCYWICPEGCIYGKWENDKLIKNTLNTDYDFCKGCGNCVKICPKKDITMVTEVK